MTEKKNNGIVWKIEDSRTPQKRLEDADKRVERCKQLVRESRNRQETDNAMASLNQALDEQEVAKVELESWQKKQWEQQQKEAIEQAEEVLDELPKHLRQWLSMLAYDVHSNDYDRNSMIASAGIDLIEALKKDGLLK